MNDTSFLTWDTINRIDEQIPELSGQIELLGGDPEFRGNYSDVYRGMLGGRMASA
jgi:hypothetical protein